MSSHFWKSRFNADFYIGITLGKVKSAQFVPDHHFWIFIIPVIPSDGASLIRHPIQSRKWIKVVPISSSLHGAHREI